MQSQQAVYGKLTFTGSGGYTTGGMPASSFSLVNPDGSKFYPSTSQPKPFVVYFQPMDTSLVTYQYDVVNDKIFAQTGGAQVAGAVTLSGNIAFEAHFGKFV
jgi:hypothetical protein